MYSDTNIPSGGGAVAYHSISLNINAPPLSCQCIHIYHLAPIITQPGSCDLFPRRYSIQTKCFNIYPTLPKDSLAD